MREFWAKLVKTLGGRRGLADELREEIESHLEFEIQENLSRGMKPDEARLAARREFGNTILIREQARETWAFRILETFLQDLRYGLRMLARNPGFTAVAVLSVALGIGANTALFGVVNAVMLRMLPVAQPEKLTLLTWSSPAWPQKFVEDVEGSVETDKQTGLTTSTSLSYAAYEHLQRSSDVLSAVIACSSNVDRVNVGLSGHAEDAIMQAVSGDYFTGLGVSTILGRTLQPRDDEEGAPTAVVVSYAFWQHKLGADPSVAGKIITINGTPTAVVGVAAREFFGVSAVQSPDLYVPLKFYVGQYRRTYDYDLQQPKNWWLTIIGRLKPGMSQTRANAELKGLFGQVLGVDGGSAAPDPNTPRLETTSASRGLNDLRDVLSTSLILLMAMVGLVLLIACANVAGLLLTRATARQGEIAVRRSLGAPKVRILRQLLTESILLGLLGGAVGLLFAGWVRDVILALLFASAPTQPIALSVQPDIRVFAFTASLSLLSGVLFGLVPALRAGRTDCFPALKQRTGTAAASGHRFLSGKILVGAQVALSLLLLVGAGLLVGTLRRLQHTELGFNRQRLLLFQVQPGLNGYKGSRLATYYQDLQRRIAAVPAVHSVGLSERGPVGDGWSQGRVTIPGYTSGKGVPFYRHWVGAGFFETLEIPLVMGRLINLQDVSSAPRSVVVNQRFVRDYLHNENPIGRQFVAGSLKAEIVGVVGDVKYGSLRNDPPPTAYLSYLQYTRDYPAAMTFEVRTETEPDGVISSIQREAAALDPDIPLLRIRTETQVIDQALFLEKTFALLSSLFGLLALLLACVGLYGTMSYTVSRRTNEIGIRLALGACRENVLRMVLREAVLLVLAGMAVGLPLAWIGTRLLENQLFGLAPHDPGTILTALVAIFAVSIIAGLLPAMRASKIDPIIALRSE